MGFYVSRQRQYYSGESIVEIESGGLDYAGADMLCSKYPGEGEEYSDPLEAAQAAIRIRNAWKADNPRLRIGVSYGQSSGGMGMEHEGDFARGWEKRLLRWAEALSTKLERCLHCNDILPSNKRDRWRANDWDGLDYCSEQCATRAAEFEAEFDAEAELA